MGQTGPPVPVERRLLVRVLAVTASTSSYRPGSTTTATEGWFLAAARTIVGPPMSICSMHSSGVAPESTVSRNG